MQLHYIIPSDNWEQQQSRMMVVTPRIISYQAITGNNNTMRLRRLPQRIISYQAITGNNNKEDEDIVPSGIISYQAITGNNNKTPDYSVYMKLYHTKR